MINKKRVLDHKNYTKHHYNVKFILFIAIKYHYFSASSLSILMHLLVFSMSLNIQPRHKSGFALTTICEWRFPPHQYRRISDISSAAFIFQRSFAIHVVFVNYNIVMVGQGLNDALQRCLFYGFRAICCLSARRQSVYVKMQLKKI